MLLKLCISRVFGNGMLNAIILVVKHALAMENDFRGHKLSHFNLTIIDAEMIFDFHIHKCEYMHDDVHINGWNFPDFL